MGLGSPEEHLSSSSRSGWSLSTKCLLVHFQATWTQFWTAFSCNLSLIISFFGGGLCRWQQWQSVLSRECMASLLCVCTLQPAPINRLVGSGMAKVRSFKFCTLVRHVMFCHWYYKLSLSWSCDVFNFWEISDNSKTVQNRRMVSIKVKYEVIRMLMTLSDPEPQNHPNFSIFCRLLYLHSGWT